MGVFITTMKMHSRKDITDKAGELNDCIKHGRKPVVEEIIAGKRKDIHYAVLCDYDDCTKFSMDLKYATEAWNKWNPKQKEAK